MDRITNVAAYKFTALDRLPQRRKTLRAECKRLELRGTILLSTEGINLFVAGRQPSVDELLDHLRADSRLADLEAKYSYCDRIPFRRMLIKIKDEIISFGVAGIEPAERTTPKLAPATLKQWLDEGRPVRLLDVRNDYEVHLGAFEDAVPIGVDSFRDLPTKIAKLPNAWKRQPVVMYCTGGIRCEKAGPYMQQHGFDEVYQLDGGILKYFETCGGAHYQGECFVFDQRVALDSQLEETDTTMCFCCQATLTADEQASPQYVAGSSCPNCYRSPHETMQRTLQKRHLDLKQLIDPLPGSVPYENRRPINVPQRCDRSTIWDVITELHPHVNQERWHAAIREGRIQRDRQPIAGDTLVRAGERIENVIPGTVEPDVNACLEIIYEDAMIVVVNKPAPLPMHPCGRFNRNTLIAILNQLYHPQKLRVAHRLDANTTGLVVLSRTRPTASILHPQFQRGEVCKTYLAKVVGHPPNDRFQCNAPINDVALRAGQREVSQTGLASLTEFQVQQRNDDRTTNLIVEPKTGRTNQIRLHLAHLGWPVCGDSAYGFAPRNKPMQTINLHDPPLCLHAWKLSFRHPLDGKIVRFEAPLPVW